MKILSDHTHPLVEEKAKELTSGESTVLDQVHRIFEFSRDDVRFGFPPTWDAVTASETIERRAGYCNTKATLFHALCKAAGIPSRIHTGLIDIEIMRGIFPSLAFAAMPKVGGHSWTEVQIEGKWRSIDAYIVDSTLYNKALPVLKATGKKTGYTISEVKGPSGCEFSFGTFVMMGAVVEDHGTWDDFAEYMASPKYMRMNQMQEAFYPLLRWMANRNIAKIRAS